MHADLFPESLLVECREGRAYTTSLKVAEHFHKRHDNVLRIIADRISLLKSEERDSRITDFWRLNFEPRDQVDGRGKTRLIYEMTHDGFALLAMSFTGNQAELWKIDFLLAFNAVNTGLQMVTERYARALDQIRPVLRPVVQGTERGLDRITIGAPLGKSPGAVTYHRRSARRLGLLSVVGV
ncbi:MAG: Rha family transcriptional regulator [Panacagrimonas sp.]